MSKRQTCTVDSNTQAMTEVALGLSMAFFSLLILALLSITSGQQVSSSKPSDEQINQANSVEEKGSSDKAIAAMLAQNRLALTEARAAKESVNNAPGDEQTEQNEQNEQNKEGDVTFIFHYKGQYYDENLVPHSVQDVNSEQAIIVAVVPELSFNDVMQVHQDFKHKNIQITAMDENWLRAFAQRVDKLALNSSY